MGLVGGGWGWQVAKQEGTACGQDEDTRAKSAGMMMGRGG